MDNDINSNLQTNNTPVHQGVYKWQINILILLIIILIIILASMLYFTISKKPHNNKVSSVSHSTTKKTVTNSSSNPYKGWLTYSNPTYGYSLKYPANWKLTNVPLSNNSLVKANFSINISNNGYKLIISSMPSANNGFGVGGNPEIITSKVSQLQAKNQTFYKYYSNGTNLYNCSPNPSSLVYSNLCIQQFNYISIGNKYSLSPYSIDNQSLNISPISQFFTVNSNTYQINFNSPQEINLRDINNTPYSYYNKTLNLILKSMVF